MNLFLDTETTGYGAGNGGRIVEIGAVAYHNRQRITAEQGGEYHTYLNPNATIAYGAYQVHGLSEEFLADKPAFADIADDFIAYIAGHHLHFHNAAFDCAHLDAELQRAGKPPLQRIAAGITCTLKWSRANNRAADNHKLDTLCEQYGVALHTRRQRHGALIDSRLLGELYHRMTEPTPSAK